jgi:hypothetical protein
LKKIDSFFFSTRRSFCDRNYFSSISIFFFLDVTSISTDAIDKGRKGRRKNLIKSCSCKRGEFVSFNALRVVRSDSRSIRVEIRTLYMSRVSDNYYSTLHDAARQRMCTQERWMLQEIKWEGIEFCCSMK